MHLADGMARCNEDDDALLRGGETTYLRATYSTPSALCIFDAMRSGRHGVRFSKFRPQRLEVSTRRTPRTTNAYSGALAKQK
jgi:hypothetical protein